MQSGNKPCMIIHREKRIALWTTKLSESHHLSPVTGRSGLTLKRYLVIPAFPIFFLLTILPALWPASHLARPRSSYPSIKDTSVHSCHVSSHSFLPVVSTRTISKVRSMYFETSRSAGRSTHRPKTVFYKVSSRIMSSLSLLSRPPLLRRKQIFSIPNLETLLVPTISVPSLLVKYLRKILRPLSLSSFVQSSKVEVCWVIANMDSYKTALRAIY